MGSSRKATLVALVLAGAALLGGVLYATLRGEAPEDKAPVASQEQAGGPATGSPRASTPAPVPSGSESTETAEAVAPGNEAPVAAPAPAPASRPRSLASIRGGVSKALRTCSSRHTGDAVRVFVSMDARVEGGRIQPAQVRVRTSSPTSEEFVRCVGDAVQALSLSAPAGEPPGSFEATVSLLTGSP